MEPILSIHNLSKHFGKIRAVDDVSFSVEKGTIYGLLGPNGSGKTTTLGTILGVIKPQSGTYTWFGESPSADSLKRVGAVLEQPNFYPYLSARDNLKIVADIKGASYDRIDSVLELVNLGTRDKDRFKGYSLGMKQRLAIAGAMINNPEILVLDEPTNGLDPEGIIDIRNLISSIASKGTTIILASHLLDEVEKVCSHVGVLKNGKLLFSGEVGEVLQSGQSEYLEMAAEDMSQLKEVLQKYPGIKEIKPEGDKLNVFFDEKPEVKSLNQFLLGEEIVLTHLTVKKSSLEMQFLELVKKPNSPQQP